MSVSSTAVDWLFDSTCVDIDAPAEQDPWLAVKYLYPTVSDSDPTPRGGKSKKRRIVIESDVEQSAEISSDSVEVCTDTVVSSPRVNSNSVVNASVAPEVMPESLTSQASQHISADLPDVIIDDVTFHSDSDVEITHETTSGRSNPLSKPMHNVEPGESGDSCTGRVRTSERSEALAQSDQQSGVSVFGLRAVVPLSDPSAALVITERDRFSLHVWGSCRVRIAVGCVIVHGAVLTPDSRQYTPVHSLTLRALPTLSSPLTGRRQHGEVVDVVLDCGSSPVTGGVIGSSCGGRSTGAGSEGSTTAVSTAAATSVRLQLSQQLERDGLKVPPRFSDSVTRATGDGSCNAVIVLANRSCLLERLSSHYPGVFVPNAQQLTAISPREHQLPLGVGCVLISRQGQLQKLPVKSFCSNSHWLDVVEGIHSAVSSKSCPGGVRAVVAGGKGVGKSSMLQFLCNHLLTAHRESQSESAADSLGSAVDSRGSAGDSRGSAVDSRELAADSRCVYVLDIDPGQAEFTPCACLSLVRVEHCLIGPSFTHLCKPVRSVYTGVINVVEDPAGYIRAAIHLIQYFEKHCIPSSLSPSSSSPSPPPLLVNTMGWANGLGEEILIEILHQLRPSHVIELLHPTKNSHNFSQRLNHQLVSSHESRDQLLARLLPQLPGSSAGAGRLRPALSQFVHYQLLAGRPNHDVYTSNKMAPWMLRNLNTTAFLASLEKETLLLHKAIPKRVPWSMLAVQISGVHVQHEHALAAINGAVVALATTDPATWPPPPAPSLFSNLPLDYRPIVICHGFGLVRGIDPAARCLYILTDLASHQLRSVVGLNGVVGVNTLLRGPHHSLPIFGPSLLGSMVQSVARNVAHHPPGTSPTFTRPNRRPMDCPDVRFKPTYRRRFQQF